MNNTFISTYGSLMARVFLSALFIIGGTQMLFGFVGASAFVGGTIGLSGVLAMILTIIVIAVKILGGLAVATGYKMELGAWALIIFSLLTIVLVHNNMAEMVSALKNLAIIGGLLLLIMHGAGSHTLSMSRFSRKGTPMNEGDIQM